MDLQNDDLKKSFEFLKKLEGPKPQHKFRNMLRDGIRAAEKKNDMDKVKYLELLWDIMYPNGSWRKEVKK